MSCGLSWEHLRDGYPPWGYGSRGEGWCRNVRCVADWSGVPAAPLDPILGMSQRFQADTDPRTCSRFIVVLNWAEKLYFIEKRLLREQSVFGNKLFKSLFRKKVCSRTSLVYCCFGLSRKAYFIERKAASGTKFFSGIRFSKKCSPKHFVPERAWFTAVLN